jgi:hypothetical protein
VVGPLLAARALRLRCAAALLVQIANWANLTCLIRAGHAGGVCVLGSSCPLTPPLDKSPLAQQSCGCAVLLYINAPLLC